MWIAIVSLAWNAWRLFDVIEETMVFEVMKDDGGKKKWYILISKGKIFKITKCYLKGREREIESDYLKL